MCRGTRTLGVHRSKCWKKPGGGFQWTACPSSRQPAALRAAEAKRLEEENAAKEAAAAATEEAQLLRCRLQEAERKLLIGGAEQAAVAAAEAEALRTALIRDLLDDRVLPVCAVADLSNTNIADAKGAAKVCV